MHSVCQTPTIELDLSSKMLKLKCVSSVCFCACVCPELHNINAKRCRGYEHVANQMMNLKYILAKFHSKRALHDE